MIERRLGWVDHDKRKRYTYLHAEVRVSHATIDRKLGQLVAAILFHGVEYGLGLEACSFHRCPSNMALLGVLGNPEHGSLSVVDPVRSEEAAERSDEVTPSIVFDGSCAVADLGRRLHELEVVYNILDGASGNGYAAFQRINGFPLAAEVVCHGRQQPMG